MDKNHRQTVRAAQYYQLNEGNVGLVVGVNTINDKVWNDEPLFSMVTTCQQCGCSPQFRFINVTDGLVDGENDIEIDVWDGVIAENAIPKPMALPAEWYVFGQQIQQVEDGNAETN